MESLNWSTPKMSRTSARLETCCIPGQTTDFRQRSENRYSREFRTLGCEAGIKSIMQQEQEVRALQRALNLPQAPVLQVPQSLMKPDMSSFNALLSSSTHQTRIVTETDLKTKTDSLYFCNTENLMPNSSTNCSDKRHDFYRTLDRDSTGTPLSSSRAAHVSGGVNITDYHQRTAGDDQLLPRSSKLSDSHLLNPRETTSMGGHWDRFYDAEKDCFTDSSTVLGAGGASLLDKFKDAQQVIEHQNEVLGKAENKIFNLQEELKKMALDKEICEEEIVTLKKEREYFDGLTSQGTKKRQELLTKLNHLDLDIKELTVSHNALLVENKKKEADLLQTEMRLNTLEECNYNLQQAKKKLLNEQEQAQQHVNQLLSDQKVLQTEIQQAKGETATFMQANKRLASEVAELKSRCTELTTQLWDQNAGRRKLMQELEELQMAYELKCNRVSLLEEEVKQQQETFELLSNEQEQSLKTNTEQMYQNKEALYLDQIRKLAENKVLLQRSFQELIQKNMQLENGVSETTGLSKSGTINTENLTEKQNFQVSSLQRQVNQLMIENSNLAVKLHDVESLREELSQSHGEQSRLLEQLQSLNKDHTRKKSQSIADLQENLKQIKSKVMSLEKEKCDLMSNLQELQQDRDKWSKEKKELMLSLAELEAENSKMRDHIQDSSSQVSSDALSDEFQAIKQELDQVHKVLRLKDEELERQTGELQDKCTQLNRFNEENIQLKKDFADMSSKTSARNLVISTLRDQLEEQTQRISQLEHELDSTIHQYEELNTRHTKLEKELCQPSPEAMKWISSEKNMLVGERDLLKIQVCELKFRLNEFKTKYVNTEEMLSSESASTMNARRKSDGCLTSSHHGRLSQNDERLRSLKKENKQLKVRLNELVVERNSVLQDSEDLMEGMQQLKEAFEDEIDKKTRESKAGFNQKATE